MPKETLTSITSEHKDEKKVYVDPSKEQRSVSYQAPDAATQEYIREHIIKPTAQAYGVNPDTGAVTPFEALGYNPEDERKRREAERALNDRKRKENAWYNAFAVLGDSLTAALGGNVWQRQPNNIGAKANADNQRLIAEQKAEDMNNAAMLRNAGVKYADAVNRLIQNYLTKTTTTSKTGGSRTEINHHPQVVSTRQEWHKDEDGNSGSRSNSSGSGAWKDNGMYQVGVKRGNQVIYRDITGKDAKNLVEIARKVYGDVLAGDNPELRDKILRYLGPSIVQQDAQGNYKWNDENLLRSGAIFDATGLNHREDGLIRDYYQRITGDNADTTPAWDIVLPAEQAIQAAQQSNIPPYKRQQANSNDNNIPPYKRK